MYLLDNNKNNSNNNNNSGERFTKGYEANFGIQMQKCEAFHELLYYLRHLYILCIYTHTFIKYIE